MNQLNVHVVSRNLFPSEESDSLNYMKLRWIIGCLCLVRVDGIDPALRRPGRFDSEIEVTVPTIEERLQILEV